MKLVFYSKLNKEVDLEFINLLRDRNAKIGYIPSATDESMFYFKELKNYYKKYHLKNFLYFDLDKYYERKRMKQIFDCEALILSGGNTYYFLWLIRKRRFASLLRKFVKRGGILVGISAGGIIMTPNINTAKVPSFDCDENKIGIKNTQALNLVNFEFLPHFKNNKRYIDEVLGYSKKSNFPIFACSDKDGILINENKLIFVNNPILFFNGKIYKVFH